ncbi:MULTISPECIES: efflux RND transporter periplasmic adaptor subunit [Acidithiobacillus]|uniref:Efflux RND transporter periplasmic adaptor subunit n=1 Tax=Acidithiobacillus ferruginosus TaxID=3063951 RepID=A0ACD5IH10_9PROT|nr:efflux RND transporter periplasmic adaptor subunit [Acidithiobacillus ferruginosus]MBU2815271.1 efflux RND transporter periplasmic adaptor subunit [Acidithiobacillus ferruginosus]
MNTRKRTARIAALIFAMASLAACGKSPPEAPLAQGKVSAPVLQTRNQSMAAFARVPGTVVARQQVQLSSRLSGYIHSMSVRDGQSVQAGQLLFEVDPTDVVGQVQQAQAGLAEAQSALTDARSNYERFKILYAQKAIPKQQWDQIKSAYGMAQARVAAARGGVGTARSQLRYARVTAPFSGIITRKFLQNGDLASPGQPILALADTSRLEVQCSVSGTLYHSLQIGQKVAVLAEGKRVPATVLDLVGAADAMTHAHTVKLSLPADSTLQAGDYVSVEVPVTQRQVMTVPAVALLDRAGIPGVFVVDAQGVAHYRMVRPGPSTPEGVEILSGLSAGETVVVGNLAAVNNGDHIEPAGATHG